MQDICCQMAFGVCDMSMTVESAASKKQGKVIKHIISSIGLDSIHRGEATMPHALHTPLRMVSHPSWWRKCLPSHHWAQGSIVIRHKGA